MCHSWQCEDLSLMVQMVSVGLAAALLRLLILRRAEKGAGAEVSMGVGEEGFQAILTPEDHQLLVPQIY